MRAGADGGSATGWQSVALAVLPRTIFAATVGFNAAERARRWPAAPRADRLRTLGIEITFSREGRAGSRISRVCATQENTVSSDSIVRDHGRRVTATSP